MGQTKQKYFTFKQKQTITGKTEFDPNSSVVTMHISDGIYRNANAIHELKHAYDLWKGIYTYDLNSEIVAYQRQYAFDVNSMPSVIPNHFKDVNSSYVGRIVGADGNFLYKILHSNPEISDEEWLKYIDSE